MIFIKEDFACVTPCFWNVAEHGWSRVLVSQVSKHGTCYFKTRCVGDCSSLSRGHNTTGAEVEAPEVGGAPRSLPRFSLWEPAGLFKQRLADWIWHHKVAVLQFWSILPSHLQWRTWCCIYWVIQREELVIVNTEWPFCSVALGTGIQVFSKTGLCLVPHDCKGSVIPKLSLDHLNCEVYHQLWPKRVCPQGTPMSTATFICAAALGVHRRGLIHHC